MLDPALTKEIVASLPDRARFEATVQQLLSDGFERTDLSVLASHDSLEVVSPDPAAREGDMPAILATELPYLGPLTVAGLILVGAGPVGAIVAGLIGAGVGGLALRQLLDEVTVESHAEALAKAVETGEILLWVRISGPERLAAAERILTAHGARHLERLGRVAHESGEVP